LRNLTDSKNRAAQVAVIVVKQWEEIKGSGAENAAYVCRKILSCELSVSVQLSRESMPLLLARIDT